MRSSLKRTKVWKHAARPNQDHQQTHEVIEISSGSEGSEPETAFDKSNLTSRQNNKQNSSNDASNRNGVLAPIFLRTKKTKVKSVSAYSQPHIIEVDSTSCQEPDKLPISGLDVCLRDVQVSNPAFPVNNFFNILHKKHCQGRQYFTSSDKVQANQVDSGDAHERSSAAEEDKTTIFSPSHVLQDITMLTPEKHHKTNRLSRTRRLKYGSGRLENIIEQENKRTKEPNSDQQTDKTSAVFQREPFSEDVLWTDKYCPCHSSEIIGNVKAIEKLHSWLKKWKLKSDVEERKKFKEKQSNDSWDCGDFVDEVGSEDTQEELCNTILICGPPGVGKTASVYACAMELGFKVFEVNCSSQRSGREVLAQLKEATQSHQVEISGKDPLKPSYFNSYNAVRSSPKSDILPVKMPKKATVSTSKKKPVQIKSSGKESDKPITLTSYFKTKAKADHLYHYETTMCKKSTTKKEPPDSAVNNDSTNKKVATSLILFEEVDVIFEDDVGFLAAIKTFMATTKRPVVMTTSDPLFRERFNSCLNEIIFQTPSVGDVCSYLRLVCLAENVHLDPDDVRTLFTLTQGDVRRCLLQLQLWSTGYRSHRISEVEIGYKGCSETMLGLQSVSEKNLLRLLQPASWTEQQMKELLIPMTESWRNGSPILYSNLELLLHKADNMCFGQDGKKPLCDTQQTETSSRCSNRSAAKTKSRLCRKKNILSTQRSCSPTRISQKPQSSTDKLETANSLSALSDFFDTMSFIDATAPMAQILVSGPRNPNGFVWTGAKLQDGLLDEMREEEDKNQETLLDIRAALEALGFHCCWRQADIYEIQRSRRGDASKNLNNITQHLDPHIASQRFDLSKKVLSSRYFSLLQNKYAVCVDYLPVVRFICRTHRKRKKHTEELDRRVKAFRTQLGLSKNTVKLLAGDVF
ncbi:ATPase family AAA domain-containing protein 5b isoform X2 [Boleophthalmus pectinirostris]|uniref:ATPase family AAA domain-containing protein 5b isoform X2 n=1 Tax=Boleophthalmus pectinirostris TaxID=150288 RepID=UPI002431CB9A|nr:ATPase family AAA domain-containing protein 5b isoform X2 [Boleophthalmus pectinirostris]